MNVNSAELDKFSKIASRWWDPFGPVKTLHDINPLRLKFILQYCNLENMDVLDVGCGGGILSEAMAEQRARVHAIDLNEKLIEVAKFHLFESKFNIHYQCRALEEIAESAASYDVITCMELLEHVPDPASIIRQCAKLLKPNGFLFCSTLNRNFKSWFFSIVMAEHVLEMIPKGTHSYESFIKPSELFKVANHAGLELKDLVGIHYNPVSQYYKLSQDVSVNYMMCLQKC